MLSGLWLYVMVRCVCCFFFFKQKTAYEMRISDWSSDVCSSDLRPCDEREQCRDDQHSRLRREHHAAAVEIVGDRAREDADQHDRDRRARLNEQIGRASCRERVCQYV